MEGTFRRRIDEGNPVGDMTLIDTNILIDIWTQDPNWYQWSSGEFGNCLAAGEVAINPEIAAELSLGFSSETDFQSALALANLIRLDLPFGASFRAGEAYKIYRKRGGRKTSTLPDFFIGAHAELSGIPILTRNPSGFQTYFPRVALISP